MKKVYIVYFDCCRLDPKSVYGVYSTKKKAQEVADDIDGWIQSFEVNKERKIYGKK